LPKNNDWKRGRKKKNILGKNFYNEPHESQSCKDFSIFLPAYKLNYERRLVSNEHVPKAYKL
jgi:hypothetical protein